MTTTGTDRTIQSLPAKLMLGAIGLTCLAQCDQRSDQSLANACTAFYDELRTVQTCQSADQCGQILTGTSCGCTHDLVANKNADAGRFRDLQKEVAVLRNEAKSLPDACDGPGFGSSCDCPAAEGFVCVQGLCSWNYTQ